MELCYIDESGTPDLSGNTSHYVLVGLSIPVEKWKDCDNDIEKIKSKYNLSNEEIHIAWLLRSYPEQNKISGFERLTWTQRKQQVASFRTAELLRLQRSNNNKLYWQTKKNYSKTEKYTHLTQKERQKLVFEVAQTVSNWSFARLFAECVDKVYFASTSAKVSIEAQSFEQVISRFEQYLQATNSSATVKKSGLLIHDNNETVAKKHTLLMKDFHKQGTLWISLKNIVETPLFVNSELTVMIQVADLCAYSLRRYLENEEEELFNLIFKRTDTHHYCTVGVRHFASKTCSCKICVGHKKTIISSLVKIIKK